jgi:hypothetical protein
VASLARCSDLSFQSQPSCGMSLSVGARKMSSSGAREMSWVEACSQDVRVPWSVLNSQVVFSQAMVSRLREGVTLSSEVDGEGSWSVEGVERGICAVAISKPFSR